MSKSRAPVSFASKSMFDVLGADEPEIEESEEEQEEIPTQASQKPLSSTEPILSKSAKKRLARQAAKSNGTSKAEETTSSSSEQPNVSKLADPSESFADAVKTNGDGVEELKQPHHETSKPNGFTSVEPVPAEPSQSNAPVSKATAPPVTEKPAKAKPVVIEPGLQKSESTTTQPSSPGLPKSSFAPDLPSSLPAPPSSDPANRKRKIPQEFSKGPDSPSKLAVKFEDGVVPGEGAVGEKTIPKVVEPKNRNVIERTVWTFIMIGGFITLLCLGHPYMILLVLLCQTLVYKEVTALFQLRDHKAASDTSPDSPTNERWSKTLNWYFFVVTNYFLYGESIIYYFKHIVFVDAYFIPFARNHRFISFMLYIVGFVGFVANLQRQHLRQQFALFCWVHISLLLIVVSSHFIVNSILEGLIWFFVPASLVINNDVMAYVCGKLFGRTPLIKLSPKKTVEGFVGAFILTLIFGLAWGTLFMRFPYMICPARDLGTNVFSHITCKPNPVFVYRNFEFTGAVRQILSAILGRAPPAIPYAPFHIHVLVMATFASLVAPFGGFFASGFKRAFNIKDFGHSIPGHGGMTDRMDCQFMMGMFSYVYYSSLIRIQYATVGSVMQTIVMALSTSEQLELLSDLKRFLEGQGVKM